jgi:hypothetical protein
VSTSFDCQEDGGHCEAGLLASDQEPVNLPSLRPKLSQPQFSSRAVNPEKSLEFLGTDPQRSHTSGLSPTIQWFLAWLERAGIKTSRPRFSRTEGKTPAFVEGEIRSFGRDRDIYAYRPARSLLPISTRSRFSRWLPLYSPFWFP